MVKRALFSVSIGAPIALGASLFAACGGSSNPGPTRDAGKADGTSPQPEAGAPEVSLPDVIASPEAGLPEGSVFPNGTQLLASPTVVLQGVTSDGYAIYTDNMTNVVSALSITAAAGTPPTTIGSVSSSGNFWVAVSGPVVAFWTPINMTTYIGPLSIWTAAHGMHALATVSQAPNYQVTNAVFAASTDGAHVFYVDNAGSVTGDLYAANTDGTGKTKLVEQTATENPNCNATLTFAGTYAVAAFCGGTVLSPADAGAGEGGADAGISDAAADAVAPDAGTAPGTVVSFAAPSWALASKITNVQPTVTADTAGTELLVSAPSGLFVYPIAGGVPTRIDSAAGSAGTLTSDGGATVYTTTATALKRSPVVSPQPVTLVPTGGAGIIALSTDNNWVQTFLNVDQTGYTDLYLASATTAGTATTLGSVPAAIFGDAFTTDSTYALYYTNLDENVFTGTFTVANCNAPGSGGGTAIGMNAWENFATTGTKVIYNDNYMQGMGSGLQTADLKSVDVTAPSPTLLVTQADAFFFLSADKTKIIYTWTYEPGPQAGLWVLPAP